VIFDAIQAVRARHRYLAGIVAAKPPSPPPCPLPLRSDPDNDTRRRQT